VYPENEAGLPLTISRQTAKGMVKELSSAGFAKKWEFEMLAMIDKDKVDSQLLKFYTMGEQHLSNHGMGVGKSHEVREIQRLNDVTLADSKTKSLAVREKVESQCSPKPIESVFNTNDLLKPADTEYQVDLVGRRNTDYSTMMEEISVTWTWGMKYLFQRFTVRTVTSTPVKGPEESKHYLWPFSQPPVNNRNIDVAGYMWDEESHTKKLIETIFTNVEPGFDSQAVYSTPFSVRRPTAKDKNGEHAFLEAMVEGTQTLDTDNNLIFSDLIAQQCSLLDMQKCYKAMVVSCTQCVSNVVMNVPYYF
jgi:hypothetical protein